MFGVAPGRRGINLASRKWLQPILYVPAKRVPYLLGAGYQPVSKKACSRAARFWYIVCPV